MPPCCLLRFLVLCCFSLLLLAHSPIKYYGECPLYYRCKNLDINFPLNSTNNSECGLQIRGCDNLDAAAEVQLGNQKWYEIIDLSQQDEPYSITVREKELEEQESTLSTICASDFHYTFPPLPRFTIVPLKIPHILVYKCQRTQGVYFPVHPSRNCPGSDYIMNYFGDQEVDNLHLHNSSCSEVQLPIEPAFFNDQNNDPFEFLKSTLHIQVNLSETCLKCYQTDDTCLDNGTSSQCYKAKEKPRIWKVIVGSVTAGAVGVFIIAVIIYRRRFTSSSCIYQSRNISRHPHSNGDLEASSIFFRIPLFSYKELEEATNNFDRTRLLGEGGFGIVYHGKLRDGREVAVKRLHEHSYKRVQQFMTETKILTRLRHRNPVTLYGYTSHHSRELLLVYEYIPNGTLACHLHGRLAKPGSLPWPVRMRIAIETASALAYLHASDTIHRDVKTNNILLDNQFGVKVADFGLSRLFPNDVTHVSTAPQGTPGYLDPEYHLCYQVTSKSDVYSFGVVLIELVSSLLAVDITRLRDEINLANLAKKKIVTSALSELVDPSLGFESDNEVKRMIVSVAELAFLCLHLDKQLRPTMDEVLKMLERIENGTDELEHLEEEDLHEVQMSNSTVHLPPSLSPKHDEVGSLKNLKPPRPHHTH